MSMQNLQSLVGVFALLGIAWIASEDRRGVAWKQAAVGHVVTFITAVILLKVPGVHAVTRIKGEPFAVSIGGAEQQVAHTGPRYSALYEIEGPHVLVSAAWAEAVERGRWPSQVRPYTRNRRHALYQIC